MSIPPLEHPDRYHVNAAAGWLELGNWLEANEELENVSAILRTHPEVLALRWQVYNRAKRHETALDIANAFTQVDPKNSQAWNSVSISLYRLGKTQEAFDLLTA